MSEIKEMTREDLENFLLDYEFMAKAAGFASAEEMNNFKFDASLGMIKFGGSFARLLGEALAHADSKNTAKIFFSFKAECEEHAALYRKFCENQGISKNK